MPGGSGMPGGVVLQQTFGLKARLAAFSHGVWLCGFVNVLPSTIAVDAGAGCVDQTPRFVSRWQRIEQTTQPIDPEDRKSVV